MTAPTRDAIIVADASDPLRRVARVPLLVRTLLALQEAGVERCTLIGALRPPTDARIRLALRTAPTLTVPTNGALHLVVGAGTVIDTALVSALQTQARPGEVVEVEADGVRVRVAPGPRVAGNGVVAGAPHAGTLRRADAPDVEGALLRGLENPRDGYLDRLLHRRLSRPLTRLLLPTGISPNVLTVVGILGGIAGGLLLARPGVLALVVALLLLELSAVLDCVDGELARVCHAESRLGHWLDVSGDTVVHVAVLGGIAVRAAAAGAAPRVAALVALLLGVLGAFAVITWSDETEERRRRVPSWENRVLDGVLSPLTTRDWHVFPVAFALAGRLDLLVPAAALGANLFWLVALVLLVRVLSRT